MSHRIVSDRFRFAVSALLLACLAIVWSFDAAAEQKTVCTVTINSSDEKETFQRHLPRDKYRFVELVQRGQPDWLESARRRGVRCDALIISGHFDDGSEFEGRAGMDLKMGLGSNLTLDATLNPDFGQVEADPAELNLSAFETFFDERRGFFLEGDRLLRHAHTPKKPPTWR